MNRIYMTFSRIIQHDKKQNHDDKIAIRNLNLQRNLCKNFVWRLTLLAGFLISMSVYLYDFSYV